ncbi:MAG: TIGR00730 family Rossman fold protein [Flavobacteriaceae bacterium]
MKKQQKPKNWHEIKANDSWALFKIMSEFVEGYETLARIGPCISVFGSARTEEGHPHYEMAVEVAEKIVESGYGVITGGGPGLMEAANRGAKNAGGISVGLNIDLPFEQFPNPYIDNDKLINFQYFFVRKVIFVKYAQGFIVMPGGFGTLDELFEAITLIQTHKVSRFPIVLVGKSFWGGLMDWIQNTLLSEGYISDEDMFLFELVDTPAEAVEKINHFYTTENFRPNF